MQTIFVKACKDCNEIKSLVSSIDTKIKELTTNSLYNKKYLADRKTNRRQLQDLIYYRSIADNLYWDSNYYYPDYTRTQIISQIKTLLY